MAALLQLGLAERGRGNLEAATAAFERAQALDPQSSITLFHYGEALYNRGLSDQARQALEAAVQRNPDNADAYYLLAFVYGDLGEHERARAATTRATQLNPTLARAQSNLVADPLRGPGPICARLPRWASGVAAARRSRRARASPTTTSASPSGRRATTSRRCGSTAWRSRPARIRGWCARPWRRFICSVATWPRRSSSTTRCSPRSPARPSCGTSAASACTSPAGGMKPCSAYEQALAADPAYALAWNNLGVLRTQLPDGDQALDAFQQALRLNPDLTAARLNLALALFHRRRLQLALEAYRQVLAEHPQNAVAWNGVGLVLVELKRFEDAKHAFSRAVEADPANASAHYNLSFTLSHLGDFDGALRATKRALELEPFYVAQKYALTIDLQYEHPEIAVVPEISADITADAGGRRLPFRRAAAGPDLRRAAASGPAAPIPPAEDPLALAADYIAEGLPGARHGPDRARAGAGHRARPGQPLCWARSSPGAGCTARHWSGSASALSLQPQQPRRSWGRSGRCWRWAAARKRWSRPNSCCRLTPDDVEALVAVGPRPAGRGPCRTSARGALRQARAIEPGRADLLQLEAGISAAARRPRRRGRGAVRPRCSWTRRCRRSGAIWVGSRSSGRTGSEPGSPTNARSTCCPPTWRPPWRWAT